MSVKRCYGLLLALACSSYTVAAAAKFQASLEQAQVFLSHGDYASARPLFEQQAKAGNGLAQFTLGLFYQLGWGVEASAAQSCHWFKLAAQQSIPAAQEQLGYCYLRDDFKTAEQKLAYGLFEQAYQAGILSAGCELGKLLVSGKYVGQQLARGTELCQQAALAGSHAAQLQLAHWLLAGQVLQQDAKQALLWFERAAKNGNGEAAYHVASFYDTGTVVTSDSAKALQWYEVAAAAGYSQAFLPAAALTYQQFIESVAGAPATQLSKTQAEQLARAYVLAVAARQKIPQLPAEHRQATDLLTHLVKLLPAGWQAQLDAQALALLQ